MHFMRQMKGKINNTIALYLIVRALDPGIPRTLREMSKAMSSLMTALDAYTVQLPTISHKQKPRRTVIKSYSILDVYRQRVVNTVAAVILGVENSVATTNMDRQHYTVNTYQIAILFPLVETYCNHNLAYKLKKYPTLWGSNAEAMKPGAWTPYIGGGVHPEHTGAPFLYIVCIHLYYIIFKGSSYGKMTHRAKEKLPIHEFSQFIYNAEKINNFWMDQYCNVEGSVSAKVQEAYALKYVMHRAHELEQRYQMMRTLNPKPLSGYQLACVDDKLFRPTTAAAVSADETTLTGTTVGGGSADQPNVIDFSCVKVLSNFGVVPEVETVFWDWILHLGDDEYGRMQAASQLECLIKRGIEKVKTAPKQRTKLQYPLRSIFDDGLDDCIIGRILSRQWEFVSKLVTSAGITYECTHDEGEASVKITNPTIYSDGNVVWDVLYTRTDTVEGGELLVYDWESSTWAYDTSYISDASIQCYYVALRQLMALSIMRHIKACKWSGDNWTYDNMYTIVCKTKVFEFNSREFLKVCLTYVDKIVGDNLVFKMDGFLEWLIGAQGTINGKVYPNVNPVSSTESKHVPTYLLNPALFTLLESPVDKAKDFDDETKDVAANIIANVDSVLPLGAPYETVTVATVGVKDTVVNIQSTLNKLFWNKFKLAEPV